MIFRVSSSLLSTIEDMGIHSRSQIAKLEQLPSAAWDGEVGEIDDLRDYSSEIGGGPCHAGSDSVLLR